MFGSLSNLLSPLRWSRSGATSATSLPPTFPLWFLLLFHLYPLSPHYVSIMPQNLSAPLGAHAWTACVHFPPDLLDLPSLIRGCVIPYERSAPIYAHDNKLNESVHVDDSG